MKVEQDSANTSEQEINRRILNGLPSDFDIVFSFSFLMFAGIKFNKVRGALARIEDKRTRDRSTGGTYALATRVKPRRNGQRSGSGDRGGCAKHDSRGHHHYQHH